MLKSIVQKNKDDIAFIIGNGINRYPNNPPEVSWDNLLLNFWSRFSTYKHTSTLKGLSLTEFYDLLDLDITETESNNNVIQKEVKKIMMNWKPLAHHKNVVEGIQKIKAPILTTNFDLALPKSLNLIQHKLDYKPFTHYYPWGVYYGSNQWTYAEDGFGIWYINGLIDYHTSIRLGLTHYMGSVRGPEV